MPTVIRMCYHWFGIHTIRFSEVGNQNQMKTKSESTVKPKRTGAAKPTRKTAKTAPKSAKTHKPAGKPGRPSAYSLKLSETICDRIAAGESLRKICLGDEMPHFITVIRWLGKDQEFASRYAHAREIQAQTFVDKMLDVAEEDPKRNPITGALDSASVAHIRNRIATMQWLAAKLNPKKYGDKLDLNHGGQKDNPLSVLLKEVSGTSLPVVPDDSHDD